MAQNEIDTQRQLATLTGLSANAVSDRDLARLKKQYGGNRWRKLKGKAYVMKAGRAVLAEVHWYECTGIGRREERVKLYLEE